MFSMYTRKHLHIHCESTIRSAHACQRLKHTKALISCQHRYIALTCVVGAVLRYSYTSREDHQHTPEDKLLAVKAGTPG